MKKSEDSKKCNWKVLLLFVLCSSRVIEVESQLSTKFVIENATLLFHPLINATQAPLLINSTGYDLLKIKKLPWYCIYSGELEEAENESECHCEGAKFEKIPQLLPNFTRLSITNSKLKVLKELELRKYSQHLKDIHLTNLKEFYLIEPGVFKGFNQLRTIYISYAPKLFYIASEVFRNISHTFKTLRIIHSGLREIPDLRFIHDNVDIVSHLDFEGNQISEIPENFIRVRAEELIIDNNMLISVHRGAFNGSSIGILSLKGNSDLRDLHNLAFEGIQEIRELDLSSTSIVSLPSKGLEKLEFLRIQNVQSLTQIPSVYNFETLAKAYLTHSFHCCAFKFPSRHDPSAHRRLLRAIEELKSDCKSFPSISNRFDLTLQSARKLKRSSLGNESRVTETFMDDVQDEFGDWDLGVYHKPVVVSNTTNAVEVNCGNIASMLRKFELLLNGERNVHCYPKPDALNPCEDVMGFKWLRVSVWIVVSLAVFGNTAVIIVLFSHQSEFTVPKFLMLNLAVADLCMGLYLLLVAIQDLRSMGEYFNYAFVWQYGWGCRAAGWLTVFAGHLSVFTLTIITVERYFAITRAIYLNKRLKIKAASYIMICGWLYSIAMATLPLFGISNYSSTSICLPMESLDISDTTYLITVLTLNGLGFFIVVICYAQIYFSLGVETRHFNMGEMTIAKKMALLVFTNFACWAPIAFFGLTALAGYPLINVTKAKILLVFFYPINSCANPYLYAILTSQYRRDLSLLLSKFGICKQRAQQYRMNFSNPTHTIPLNGLPSTRNSNIHRHSSNHQEKPNTQFEQVLLRTNFIADNNEQDNCLPINGKSSEDVNVNREDILEN